MLCCVKGMVRWILLVVVVILAGLGACVYFFIPREPTISVVDATYQNPTITQNLVAMDLNSIISIDNPNYLAIKVESMRLAVSYRSVEVGTVSPDGLVMAARDKANHIIPVKLYTNDTSIARQMYDDARSNGGFTVRISGPAKLKVLSFDFDKDITFTQFIDTTSVVPKEGTTTRTARRVAA
eukprot:TRINITY_DN1199_c0_g1_i1.p1 TRINITY_DN1199_c0_g1~~TRINITY_DN1199_c0_g1_i1.p1  ORF type:complete len:182 (+),score=40.34 TRINITY_DN1199_c0_g1_i1:180-725(+)